MKLFGTVFILILSAGILSGCGSAPVLDRYEVRGVIAQPPHEGASGPELSLLHEAIPDFRNAEGETVGMDAMMMRFGLDPDLKLPALQAGAKVRVQFSVGWNRSPRLEIDKLEVLDPGTPLELGGYSLE